MGQWDWGRLGGGGVSWHFFSRPLTHRCQECQLLLLLVGGKAEKRMTTRSKHKRFKITLFIRTKHNMKFLGGNPLYQATKLLSLSINCDSMSFLSFTLSAKRSHSPFMWMLWMVRPVWLKWFATGLSLQCLMSAWCSLKWVSRAHPVSPM